MKKQQSILDLAASNLATAVYSIEAQSNKASPLEALAITRILTSLYAAQADLRATVEAVEAERRWSHAK